MISVVTDDVTVDPNWLISLKAEFDEFETTGVGGKFLADWTGVAKPPWAATEAPSRRADGLFLGRVLV